MLDLSKKREEKDIGEFYGIKYGLKLLLLYIIGALILLVVPTLIVYIGKNFNIIQSLMICLVGMLGILALVLLCYLVIDNLFECFITYKDMKKLYKQLVYLPISEEEINKYNLQTAGQYLYEIKSYVYLIKSVIIFGKEHKYNVYLDLCEYETVINDIIAVMENIYGQNYSYLKNTDLLKSMFTLCDSVESFDIILNDCNKAYKVCESLNEALDIKLRICI